MNTCKMILYLDVHHNEDMQVKIENFVVLLLMPIYFFSLFKELFIANNQ